MSTPSYRELTVNGLWKNNPALVQLLGLCPLLGVSNSAVNALGLGLATMLVLTCSNIGVSLVRGVVNTAVRLPAFVMIIAALTTCIELLMQAFTYELYQILGIFIPLITTNCVILGRADGFAAKHNPLIAGFDGLVMGIGFLLAMLPPGAFIVLGLLIALKNRIDQHLAERASAAQPVAPAASRRVRVTGVIE